MPRRAPAAVRDFRRLPGSALPARQAGSVPNRKGVNTADKPVTANTVASGLMDMGAPSIGGRKKGSQEPVPYQAPAAPQTAPATAVPEVSWRAWPHTSP